MKNLYLPLLLAGAFLTGCHSPSANKDATHEHHAGLTTLEEKPACHSTTEPEQTLAQNGSPTDLSLYNLESDWVNQHNDTFKLQKLEGKIQMVAMVYTSCSYACPRIIADLKRIEESLENIDSNKVGIVLVTLDPERDTPEKLKVYAAKNKLNPTRWQFLTSNESNIRELAALLNVKYKQEVSLDISHSNIISVLNEKGEVIHQQEGLGVEPDETVRAIQTLLSSI